MTTSHAYVSHIKTFSVTKEENTHIHYQFQTQRQSCANQGFCLHIKQNIDMHSGGIELLNSIVLILYSVIINRLIKIFSKDGSFCLFWKMSLASYKVIVNRSVWTKKLKSTIWDEHKIQKYLDFLVWEKQHSTKTNSSIWFLFTLCEYKTMTHTSLLILYICAPNKRYEE